MARTSVTVYAPATLSNLGSGFDIIGLAIDKPGDFAHARRRKQPGLSFSLQAKRNDLPSGMNNVAAHVSSLLLNEMNPPFGVELSLLKRMPIGSGLGSSGASSVAALVAVNALLSKPLRRIDLLRFAIEGERMASGSPHADNVAPCLLGGAVIVRSYDPLDVVSLPVRNSIFWVVVHPHLVVRTAEARNVLPHDVPLRSAVRQWGNVGGLVAGLTQGNAKLVGTCTEDIIIEPARRHLTPGFAEVKAAALNAGAWGCTFAGSGPSLFAVTDSALKAKRVASAMKRAFRSAAAVESDAYISKVNTRGAAIVSNA